MKCCLLFSDPPTKTDQNKGKKINSLYEDVACGLQPFRSNNRLLTEVVAVKEKSVNTNNKSCCCVCPAVC